MNSKEALERIKNAPTIYCGLGSDVYTRYSFEIKAIEKELKALEIIKKHILNRDMDTSGIYLEYHNGIYEPYYTIEIKEGIKQIITQEEYELLKEVLE